MALARAIAPEPKLLLLDEPFSNLDSDLRQELGQELRALLKELRITALMVTHDHTDAFTLADKIGVINDGLLNQWGTPDDLYRRPRNRFVAQFVGDGVFISGIVSDKGLIQTSLGELEPIEQSGFSQGTKVDVLMRPEQIQAGQNGLSNATITGRFHRGAYALLSAELNDGTHVVWSTSTEQPLEIGQELSLSSKKTKVICFPKN